MAHVDWAFAVGFFVLGMVIVALALAYIALHEDREGGD